MDRYVYYIGNKIYINLTNKCSNACEFCIRNGREGMQGQRLWIERQPDADEVISQLPENLDEYDEEVVFCGFGEPTYNLETLETVASFLKCVDKKVRLNTNGQANLINKADVSSVIADCCDVTNVSLNAADKVEYQRICSSVFGQDAFDALLEFAQLVKSHGGNVVFSVVDCIGNQNIERCQKLADSMGIALRVRVKE